MRSKPRGLLHACRAVPCAHELRRRECNILLLIVCVVGDLKKLGTLTAYVGNNLGGYSEIYKQNLSTATIASKNLVIIIISRSSVVVFLGSVSCRRGERHPLEFITEMPRKKLAKDGRRRQHYSDMGITMVDEGCLPSAVEFRAAGNRSLFRSEALFCDDQPETIVETTVQSTNDRHIQETCSTLTVKPDSAFITSMQRQDDIEKEAVDNALFYGDGERLGRDGMSTRLLRGAIDPTVRGDPVKLRMALKALKHTLRHPVISSLDAPWESYAKGATRTTTGKRSEVFRDTAAAVARQLPRRPYQFLRKYKTGFCERILDGPPRSSNLYAVEEVLTSMNGSNDRMALKERTRQDDTQLGRSELSTIIRKVNTVLDEC